MTLGAPGIQGATVAGMHGNGVSTPIAAGVAETTVGFAMLMHMPNAMVVTIGAKSMIRVLQLADTTR